MGQEGIMRSNKDLSSKWEGFALTFLHKVKSSAISLPLLNYQWDTKAKTYLIYLPYVRKEHNVKWTWFYFRKFVKWENTSQSINISIWQILWLVEFFYSVRLVIIKNHRKDSLNWHENSYYLLVVCNVRYVLLLCSLSRNLLKDLFQEYYECPVQDSRFLFILFMQEIYFCFSICFKGLGI